MTQEICVGLCKQAATEVTLFGGRDFLLQDK